MQNKNRIVESREVAKEKLMSTREVAEQLKTSSNVITNTCKKCLPNKKIRHGKPAFWNKEEITVILRYLQDNRTCNPTYNNLIISTRTSKSDELDYLMLVKQQQEIQAKINIYQSCISKRFGFYTKQYQRGLKNIFFVKFESVF